jgi:hypothetical protein
VNSDPRDTMTRRLSLTVLPFHFDDGKTGRNHDYESSSEKSGDGAISRGSLEVDSTVATIRPAAKDMAVRTVMVNMDLHPDTLKLVALCAASTRAMQGVYSVGTRTFGEQRLAG